MAVLYQSKCKKIYKFILGLTDLYIFIDCLDHLRIANNRLITSQAAVFLIGFGRDCKIMLSC